jgi:shikimate kinase
MAGAGKGHLLERIRPLTKWRCIDLDRFIERATGVKVEHLLKMGPSYFRDVEAKYLDQLLNKDMSILALGGGSLERGLHRVKAASYMVWLDTPFALCYLRIKNSDRPMAELSHDECFKIYQDRLPLYRMADLQIRGEKDLLQNPFSREFLDIRP